MPELKTVGGVYLQASFTSSHPSLPGGMPEVLYLTSSHSTHCGPWAGGKQRQQHSKTRTKLRLRLCWMSCMYSFCPPLPDCTRVLDGWMHLAVTCPLTASSSCLGRRGLDLRSWLLSPPSPHKDLSSPTSMMPLPLKLPLVRYLIIEIYTLFTLLVAHTAHSVFCCSQ